MLKHALNVLIGVEITKLTHTQLTVASSVQMYLVLFVLSPPANQ